MPGDDALSAAIEELYSIDPDDFTERRGALATTARQGGDANAARAITALRRPTKAAWIVNRLARDQPDVAAGLAELGTNLRTAQRSLDGARLRELTQQRRTLIDTAIRQAFELSGLAEPPAGLRHEVASTLEAALADPGVAEQVSAGTLVRSAEWSGFGDSVAILSAVPDVHSERRRDKTPAKRSGATTPTSKASTATKQTGPSEAEQRQRQRLSAAQDALDKANTELQAAGDAEREQQEKVALLTEQLADARRRLDEARLRGRQAKARQREAERRSDRAQR